jgi:hypothetical protein
MKNALCLLVPLAALVATGCSGNSSSSSSSTGGQGGACGSVTVQGQCTGSVLEYCDPNSGQLYEEDCAQIVPDGGDVYACQLIDASYGYDCAAPAGKSCVQIAMGEAYPSFCQGTGPACVYGAGSAATCELNIPACVGYDADGGFVFSGARANTVACSGELLLFYCDEDQPVAQDCTAIGGSCATLDAGAAGCVNLPSGQECDNIEFFCVSPLNCFDPDAGGVGYCG